MISYYPGPSKVWDTLPLYMQDAFQEGILSVNHRSQDFMKISRETLRLLHDKLNIPEDYTILFTSSATECWEVIAQSVLEKEKSLHLFNGAFGEKWHEYTQNITGNAIAHSFSLNELPDPEQVKVESDTLLLALTHNETSTGTALPIEFMQKVRNKFPDKLIAVDATSSIAGVDLPYKTADIWYGSVQKCFGLPAGLGIMLCGPKAIKRAKELGENSHYNSLLFMLEKIADAQTSYTPNVLGIYLLMRSLQDRPNIEATEELLQTRFNQWVEFFTQYPTFDLLIKNPEVRSKTVLTIEGAPEKVDQLKKDAKAEGLYIGNGYGRWKNNTFRIANFPALTDPEIQKLQIFLKNYQSKI